MQVRSVRRRRRCEPERRDRTAAPAGPLVPGLRLLARYHTLAPLESAKDRLATPPGRNDLAASLQIDFIGIGAPKCGTSWLFYALGQHPEICLSEPKETRFFTRDDFWTAHGPEENPTGIDRDQVGGLALYERHYRHCRAGALKGEFSPVYMYNEQAAARIHRHFPAVKLLVCLRDPVDRAHSWYLTSTHYNVENKLQNFEDAIEQDPRCVLAGYYAENLKRYLHYFSKDQIKTILFEDIVQRPEDTIRGLFRFLGVDPEIELDLGSVPKNSAKKSRLISPAPLMAWLSAWLIKHDQAVLLNRLRRSGVKKFLLRLSTAAIQHEPIDPRTRERLRRLFRDDVQELEALFGLDLTAWK